MNSFFKLLEASEKLKAAKGIVHTPAEIAQQPSLWLRTAEGLIGAKKSIFSFLQAGGLYGSKKSALIFAGAGTSEFIGTSVSTGLRKALNRDVFSIPSTHFVTHPGSMLASRNNYLFVSFARSGNSPESFATFDIVKKYYKKARQLVITCDKNGALAKRTDRDPNSYCIILPEETNDRSLVMTSSFSTMALTGLFLGTLNNTEAFRSEVKRASAGAARIINDYSDMLAALCRRPFKRVSYLGSSNLFGTMQECHLKLMEMTEGKVTCRFDSFLGLRHGPQVFINNECLIFAALSHNPRARRYELDLLRQLKKGGQGMAAVIICAKADKEILALSPHVIELYPEGTAVSDDYRVLTDIVAGQLLGLFKSLNLGHKPDSPSKTGVITRVVKGVTIYK